MRLLLRRATRAMGQQPVWIMIALVLDAVIAVTGILIGPSFNLTGLLAAGPLLACARCTGRVTALVAGYALALCVLVALVTGTTRTTLGGTASARWSWAAPSPPSPPRSAAAGKV